MILLHYIPRKLNVGELILKVKMNRLLSTILAFTLAILLAGCDKDENPVDLEPPVITMTSPEEHKIYKAGIDIEFIANFSDNEALATYSIDIHNTFDEHQHGRILEDPELIKFSFKQNYSLPSLTFASVEELIAVPGNIVAGPYHFIVQSIDAAGNATSYQNGNTIEIEIFLTNESMAVVDITNLVDEKLELMANSAFIVEGNIIDPTHPTLQGFSEVIVILGEEHDHEEGDARIAEVSAYELDLEGEALNPYLLETGKLDLKAMIDFTPDNAFFDQMNNAGLDQLLLWIQVIDRQGNFTVSETTVLLKP